MEKKNRNGRWQKRHFELERGQLHYYESKGHKYGDTIRLQDIPIELDTTDPKVLILTTPNRVLQLRADTSQAASDWLLALKSHKQAGV